MSVPTLITELSPTLASNSPAGTDVIGNNLDDYLRAAFGFIAQNYANKAVKGANSDITSLAALTGGVGGTSLDNRNILINGGMQIQQGTAVNLSATEQYGVADCWMIHIAGGTGIAGTDAISGNAYGCTSGSWTTGQIHWQQRVESINCKGANSTPLALSAKITQNTGGIRGFAAALHKANAANNFSATTLIETISLGSVESGVETLVYGNFAALGATDADNGLVCFIYDNAANTVATKSYLLKEAQLERGTTRTPFSWRKYMDVLKDCQRYYRLFRGGATGFANGTTIVQCSMSFPEMFAAPTIAATSNLQTVDHAGASNVTPSSAAVSVAAFGVSGGTVRFDNYTGLTSGQAVTLRGQSAATATLSARL